MESEILIDQVLQDIFINRIVNTILEKDDKFVCLFHFCALIIWCCLVTHISVKSNSHEPKVCDKCEFPGWFSSLSGSALDVVIDVRDCNLSFLNIVNV